MGCASLAGSPSRRPLSECARSLVERVYLGEDETSKADEYCNTYSPAQLADAERAVYSKQVATFADALVYIKHAPPPAEPAPVVAVKPAV
jgi:hypothetical protein